MHSSAEIVPNKEELRNDVSNPQLRVYIAPQSPTALPTLPMVQPAEGVWAALLPQQIRP